MAVSIQNDGEHPGEYRRETGTGVVTAVDRSKGRNVYVTINADHLREEVKAWADTHASGLDAAVASAYEAGQRIGYVIDVHRTRGVDESIPFEELGKRQKVRDLTELFAVDGAGNRIGPDSSAADRAKAQPSYRQQEAATHARVAGESSPHRGRPDAAPTRGPGAPCPRCGHPLGTVPLRRGSDGPEHVECPPPEAGPVDHAEDAARAVEEAALEEAASPPEEPPPPSDGPTEAPPATEAPTGGPAPLSAPAARAPRRGVKVAEARPWEAYNSDGSLNLGSYEVQAAVGMVELAARLIVEHNRVTSATTGHAVEAPTRGQVLGLARHLLEASDEVQRQIRADGRSDRMDASHTRARGAIRSALDLYPVPFGATPDDRATWVDDLVAYAVVLVEVAVTLTDVTR